LIVVAGAAGAAVTVAGGRRCPANHHR